MNSFIETVRQVFEELPQLRYLLSLGIAFMSLSMVLRFIMYGLREEPLEIDWKEIGKVILGFFGKAFRWLKRLCNSYYIEEIGENGKLVRRYFDSYEEAMQNMKCSNDEE